MANAAKNTIIANTVKNTIIVNAIGGYSNGQSSKDAIIASAVGRVLGGSTPIYIVLYCVNYGTAT
jgi:hypothetical protein